MNTFLLGGIMVLVALIVVLMIPKRKTSLTERQILEKTELFISIDNLLDEGLIDKDFYLELSEEIENSENHRMIRKKIAEKIS